MNKILISILELNCVRHHPRTPVNGWRRKKHVLISLLQENREKIEIVTFHAKNVRTHSGRWSTALSHSHVYIVLHDVLLRVPIHKRARGLVSYTRSFYYFKKLKKKKKHNTQKLMEKWENFVCSTCFIVVKKSPPFSMYCMFLFSFLRAGKFSVWWPIFSAPSHGELTRRHVNMKTRVAHLPNCLSFTMKKNWNNNLILGRQDDLHHLR